MWRGRSPTHWTDGAFYALSRVAGIINGEFCGFIPAEKFTDHGVAVLTAPEQGEGGAAPYNAPQMVPQPETPALLASSMVKGNWLYGAPYCSPIMPTMP